MLDHLRPLVFFALVFSVFLCAVNAQKPTKKESVKTERPNAEKLADDEEVVSVETNVTIVPVSVRDKSGRFVPNLKRENFRVAEDGVEQQIEFFEGTNVPFTIVMLLDISESTVSSFSDIQKSAVAFIEQLKPQDKVVLVPFNKYIYQRTEPTNDRELLKKEIYKMEQGGGTSVYDALDFTYDLLAKIAGRKAVVLFSDGVDTTSRATYNETLDRSKETDALIYTIRYETMKPAIKATMSQNPNDSLMRIVTAKGEDMKTAYARATVYLKFLTDNSGGRYFLADSPENLTKTFQSIAEELRQQYSVGYYPKNESTDNKTRKIKVTVDVSDAKIKARKNYVYKSTTKK